MKSSIPIVTSRKHINREIPPTSLRKGQRPRDNMIGTLKEPQEVNKANLRTRRSPRRDGRQDWSLAASIVGLLFIAGPVIGALGGALGDGVLLAAASAASAILLTRVNSAPRVLVLSSAICVTYLLSAIFTPSTEQGFRHLLTTFTAISALLLFMAFGREMVAQAWFRRISYVLICAGAIGAHFGPLSKNISGGITLYMVSLLTVVLLTQAKGTSWPWILGFMIGTTALAFTLDFRSLIGYAVVLALGFFASGILPNRLFWLVGAASSAIIISATIWYFLNATTNPFAVEVTRQIAETTGRPATSGREWIWPSIINAVQTHNPWFGFGAGALPRDILPTTLSSHSSYMQMYLQLGIVGIVLLIAFLLTVWGPLAFASGTVGRFGAAIFLMFVAHNSTEVIFFQNALIAGIPAWCAIGIAISVAARENASTRAKHSRPRP